MNLENASDVPKTRSPGRTILSIVGVLYALNIVSPPIAEGLPLRGFDEEIQAMMCVVGLLFGEACFVVVLSALIRRTWLGGYLLGVAITTFGFYSAVLGLLLMGEFDWDVLVAGAIIPALLLVAATPLLAFRQVFGWRLVWRDEPLPRRHAFGLDDLFTLVAIAGAVLVLMRAPQMVWEQDAADYWAPILFTMGLLFVIGLTSLPLCVRVAFGSRTWIRAVTGLIAIAVAVLVLSFGIVQFFASRSASWSERLEVVPYLLCLVGTTIGVFYLLLALLAYSGVRLARLPKSVASPDETEKHEAWQRRRATRWRVVTAIGVTTLISIYLASLQSWRAAADLENERLAKIARGSGGALGTTDHYVRNVTLGDRATDAMLAEFASCKRLQYLDLSSPEVTDASLRQLKHFPRLETLSLQHTQITDEGLVHLRDLKQLEHLTVEGGSITGSGVVHLGNKASLTYLALPGTQFGNAQCEVLAQFPNLTTLEVPRTAVTDGALVQLAALRALVTLNLEGTSVTWENAPRFPLLQQLTLSDSSLTDAGVKSLPRSPELQVLSLGETRITNAAMAHLAAVPKLRRLYLQDTVIDDAGMIFLKDVPALRTLDLSGTNVRGECFSSWNATASKLGLILDHTPTDDEGVRHVATLASLQKLSLSGTQVTGTCLTHLVRIGIDELDLSDTVVTGRQILANGLPSVAQLIVAPDQLDGLSRRDFERKLGISHVHVKSEVAD